MTVDLRRLSGTYPASADLLEYLPPQRFTSNGGSPAIGTAGAGGTLIGWLLDGAGATESVSTNFIAQAHWGSAVDIDLWWNNAAAGAGDVYWRVQISEAIAGAAGSPSVIDQQTVITSPANGVATKTLNFVAGTALLVPGRLYRLTVSRISGNPADTLANDVYFLGVILGKA